MSFNSKKQKNLKEINPKAINQKHFPLNNLIKTKVNIIHKIQKTIQIISNKNYNKKKKIQIK